MLSSTQKGEGLAAEVGDNLDGGKSQNICTSEKGEFGWCEKEGGLASNTTGGNRVGAINIGGSN